MGMFEELNNEKSGQAQRAGVEADRERQAANTFAVSMDQLAPEYAQAAKKMGIPTDKRWGGGVFAKRGWSPKFKRAHTVRVGISDEISKADPCRKGRFGKELPDPRLFIFTDGSWGWLVPGGGSVARPQRMSSFQDYSLPAMRDQLMGDLRERGGLSR
jgi:hypothetical protein